ncbi:hypothetical protein BGW80DRAFT_607280 [Lactifluus volemus]|nr:hypothetical protein BGW80DRAFT_607280 [Lactifluus volemus]
MGINFRPTRLRIFTMWMRSALSPISPAICTLIHHGIPARLAISGQNMLSFKVAKGKSLSQNRTMPLPMSLLIPVLIPLQKFGNLPPLRMIKASRINSVTGGDIQVWKTVGLCIPHPSLQLSIGPRLSPPPHDLHPAPSRVAQYRLAIHHFTLPTSKFIRLPTRI